MTKPKFYCYGYTDQEKMRAPRVYTCNKILLPNKIEIEVLRTPNEFPNFSTYIIIVHNVCHPRGSCQFLQ